MKRRLAASVPLLARRKFVAAGVSGLVAALSGGRPSVAGGDAAEQAASAPT